MPTSLAAGYPLWLDFETFNGLLGRQYDVAATVFTGGTATAVQIPGGVFPSAANALQVNVVSGMHVTVNAGYCVVPNTSGSTQGGYKFGLMNQATLDVTASDSLNPRIDLVVAYVNDAGSSSSFCDVHIVTGVAQTPAVAPSAPSYSIILAQLYVPPGTQTMTATGATVTDTRTYVCAPGGILPISGPSAAPAGYLGQVFYDTVNQRFCAASGSAGVVNRIQVLPWQPVQSVITSAVSDVAAKGSTTAITSVSVTTDGSTDIAITYKWAGIQTTTVDQVLLFVTIDGVTIDQVYEQPATASVNDTGGSVQICTTATFNRPSAAAHTIGFFFQGFSGTITHTMQPNLVLRVEPVVI